VLVAFIIVVNCELFEQLLEPRLWRVSFNLFKVVHTLRLVFRTTTVVGTNPDNRNFNWYQSLALKANRADHG
jgi:hypothetical protein